jgi:uncharacterized protein (TIGR02391 family)
MTMSFSTVPTAQQLRTLSTAELAMVLLTSLDEQPNPNSILREHEQAHSRNGESDLDFLGQRLSDAWAWLVANGLVGPHHRNTPSDWFRVTDRGRHVVETGSVSELLAEQRLPDDLHSSLFEARSQFRGGKAEIAVFAAMRQVEVRLREQSGAGNDMIGVALARHALRPDGGPLADDRLEAGEREAISHLFAGALGAFKNPTSHRVVNFDDPAVAADIILLADLLLRLLDARGGGTGAAKR